MSITNDQQKLIELISLSLNGTPIMDIGDDVVKEAKQQAVLPLVCFDSRSYHIIANNVQLMWEQEQLRNVLEGIPYLVLKGSCASIYYPIPLRRTMGDIDILVKPQFFKEAYDAFVRSGYTTEDSLEDNDRHVHFFKDRVIIELHRNFATLQTEKQEKLLDDWLFNTSPIIGHLDKYSFPMPDDCLNGLVLLTHINQHLEEGLGLRQIIDWIMYVRHTLPDEAWPQFRKKTDKLGLTMIALAAAKIGQVYFGINKDIKWCSNCPDNIAEALLEYAFECGNFGIKNSKTIPMLRVLSFSKGPISLFKYLQIRGITNWELAKDNNWLRPFAWLYQLIRYIKFGVRGDGIKEVHDTIKRGKKYDKLMDEIGATRLADKE